MADVFEILEAKQAADGHGGLALLVRAGALRRPSLAEQFKRPARAGARRPC
jgi:hypothetical protein